MARHDHLGRLIDHLHLVVRDLAASRKFYRSVLSAIGRERIVRVSGRPTSGKG
jgi:catechol 2,3-dioxygenase-like lactoylglutathione lyase family enzyme